MMGPTIQPSSRAKQNPTPNGAAIGLGTSDFILCAYVRFANTIEIFENKKVTNKKVTAVNFNRMSKTR